VSRQVKNTQHSLERKAEAEGYDTYKLHDEIRKKSAVTGHNQPMKMQNFRSHLKCAKAYGGGVDAQSRLNEIRKRRRKSGQKELWCPCNVPFREDVPGHPNVANGGKNQDGQKWSQEGWDRATK